MTAKVYKRSLFQRILGRPMTTGPADSGSWSYANGSLEIDLGRVPELAEPWGAVALEDERLPIPVLIFRDGDGVAHAVCNVCAHGGRRLDPVPGQDVLTCCSLGRSTYDLDGTLISGAAEENILPFTVIETGPTLLVTIK